MPFHSPYIDYSSKEALNKSLELPFPTGKEFLFGGKYRAVASNRNYEQYNLLLTYIGPNSLISTHKTDKDGNEIADVYINLNLPIDKLIYLLNHAEEIKLPADEETYANIASRLKLSVEQTKKFYDLLKLIIDKHNLYLNTLSETAKARVLDNYKMYLMFMISRDPLNLILAQSPIDAMTKPLKLKSLEILTETPGNFLIKYKDINRCLVGAKGISICATSLKAFFGLSLYYNEVLNHGTSELLGRLLFNVTIPFKEGAKTYRMLANVFPTGEITNERVLAAIQSVRNEKDAALILSALLSLSTDFNRKVRRIKYLVNSGKIRSNLLLLSLNSNI